MCTYVCIHTNVHTHKQTPHTQGDIVPEMKDSFCHRLTAQQYNSQSKDASHSALLDLLDRIIADERMNSKDKKRKLKDVSYS